MFFLLTHVRPLHLLLAATIVALMLALSACSPRHQAEVDRLNDRAYALRYCQLDSATIYAKQALRLADDYPSGRAEAINHLAFADIIHMDYAQAQARIDTVLAESDNQIELLVADVQAMRLCQRRSENKNFYNYREEASRRIERLEEEAAQLTPRQRHRVAYAKSEYRIVEATYFYYVGLGHEFKQAISSIDSEELERDTSQYLTYLYNIGSGGAIEGSPKMVTQTEFTLLMRCYVMAQSAGSPFWQANALQAISELLLDDTKRNDLYQSNKAQIDFINTDHMELPLLAGNLAQRSLLLFESYGDVYQTAGAYRSLAQCFWAIGDYESALICLNNALSNKKITQAPDLVASIREQLSLAYSALDNKPGSDENRNAYLDLQEHTRQDRQLEARANQLDRSVQWLGVAMSAVAVAIILLVTLLLGFAHLRRKHHRLFSADHLLEPLWAWKQEREAQLEAMNEHHEEIEERTGELTRMADDAAMRNLEQRTKVQFVGEMAPLIDRMAHEVQQLDTTTDADIRRQRLQYVSELADDISQRNRLLTRWIEMRQGQVALRVESFALQEVFDIVSKAAPSFAMRGITLNVSPTEATVKADRTLTLFMINTMADNARKHTSEGGRVDIAAEEGSDMVVISVTDNGQGMTEEQLAQLFNRQYAGTHGFGLINCKGILQKYKKTSTLFSHCDISAESAPGKGSRFTITLPKGRSRLARTIIGLMVTGALMLSCSLPATASPASATDSLLSHASLYADKAYYSNIAGRYDSTLCYADSALALISAAHQATHTESLDKLSTNPQSGAPAEISWWEAGYDTRYEVILDVRNEAAVAALALHQWHMYHYNNRAYTQLFRLRSADASLPQYVQTMQRAETARTMSVVLLIVVLLLIVPAYYLLYYRHEVTFRLAVDRLKRMGQLLADDTTTDEQKLSHIAQLWPERRTSYKATEAYDERLEDAVNTIRTTLTTGINSQRQYARSIEESEEELHKAELELYRLHTSNNILDNCLSALKHETMYYPARIEQLIAQTDTDTRQLQELIDYYRQLYSLLWQQALQQTHPFHFIPARLLPLITLTLRRATGLRQLVLEPAEGSDRGGKYTRLEADITAMGLPEDAARQLFTAHTSHPDFLLSRQIVREVGEATMLRRCGVESRWADGRHTIVVTLPSAALNEGTSGDNSQPQFH